MLVQRSTAAPETGPGGGGGGTRGPGPELAGEENDPGRFDQRTRSDNELVLKRQRDNDLVAIASEKWTATRRHRRDCVRRPHRTAADLHYVHESLPQPPDCGRAWDAIGGRNLQMRG